LVEKYDIGWKSRACSPHMRFKAFTSLGKVFGLLGCCAVSMCSLLPTLLDHVTLPGHQ